MDWTYCKTTDFTAEDLRHVYTQMSPTRKARIDRLRCQEAVDRSLAAECLVYRLLEKEYGIVNAKLHSRENGAPYLTGCDLHVSISHADDWVACAVSNRPVGIDIERIRPVKDSLYRHVCTQEELDYLQAGEGNTEVMRRFFEIWTAKEAYFKKCGTGITNLKQVNTRTLQGKVWTFDDYFIQIVED